MVLSLRSTLGYGDISLGIVGGLGKDLEEQRLVDVVGAGAGYEVATRLKEFEGAQVDLLVAALRSRDAVSILGKGRRIEDDHPKAAAGLVILLQQVEGVALAEMHIGDSVKLLVLLGR